MATVKKNEKSTKAKAGSSKTGRSPALKAKDKAAAAKKNAASARPRSVSKPASKKTAATKTPAKATASRARSTVTRQRTVATPVSSRSAARGTAKASVRATPVKTAKKKAEQSKAKTVARTNSSAVKAAAAKVAAAKVAAKTKAKTATAASKAKASAKPASAKPAVQAKTVKKVEAAKTPSVKTPGVKSPAVKTPVKLTQGKLAPAKTVKKVDQAAPVKNASPAPKKAAVVPAIADPTISTKPAKAEPAGKAAELKLAPKTSADNPAETLADSASLNTVASKLPTADSSAVSPAEPVAAIAKKAEEKIMIGKAAKPSAPTDTAVSPQDAKLAKPAEAKSEKVASKPAVKAASPGKGFKVAEFIVYPAHGVGEIIAIEEQEVAGFKLELFVISFIKDKMILKVPVTKVAAVGMRKLAESGIVKKALDTLMGRARIKRTMWSRRAQEYEAKINSGDLVAIAEVVRDLYRSDAQPEQSYSERQLYEAALDRLAREVGTVQKLTETEALKVIETQLQKGPRRTKADEVEADLDGAESEEGEIEEAA